MEDDSIYERGQAIADRRPWLLGDWPGLTNRGLAEAAGEDDRAAERPPSKIAVNP